jgi:hypothetical protein
MRRRDAAANAELDKLYGTSINDLRVPNQNEQAAASDAQFNARRNQLLQRAEQVSGETEASRAFNLRLQANMRRIRQQENDAPIPQISPERAAANSEWFRNADRDDPTIQRLNRFQNAAGRGNADLLGPTTPRGQEWRDHVEMFQSEQAARDNQRGQTRRQLPQQHIAGELGNTNLSGTALENLRAMYTSPENLAMLEPPTAMSQLYGLRNAAQMRQGQRPDVPYSRARSDFNNQLNEWRGEEPDVPFASLGPPRELTIRERVNRAPYRNLMDRLQEISPGANARARNATPPQPDAETRRIHSQLSDPQSRFRFLSRLEPSSDDIYPPSEAQVAERARLMQIVADYDRNRQRD